MTKIYCQICKNEFYYSSFPKHLKKDHVLGSEEYFLSYVGTKGYCQTCGKPTKFISISKGYYKYCSLECSHKSENRRKKIEETCLQKYGVKTPLLDASVIEKRNRTILERYKVKHPAQNKEIKEKMETTCLLKYGVTNPNKVETVKELKIKNSIVKYGTNYPTQTKEFIQKSLKTKRNNFLNRLFLSDRLQNKCIPNFEKPEYFSVNEKYSWTCCKCNNPFEDILKDGRIPRCPICYPKHSGSSIMEKEIADFCKQYFPNLIEHDHIILDGKEIDIFIPEINLAIEFDGLYWHSELNGVNQSYHLEKLEKCLSKNIRLIHIFEDEWYDKREIVKSILKAKMGKIENKIYARECIVKKVSNIESKTFLFENHIQGPINGKTLGLFKNDELVSIVTYGKPRFNTGYDVEILRFCNKRDLVVVGGLSKLISNISGHIISYCDRRYSDGNGYIKAGFVLSSFSPPNYYYLKIGGRMSRIQFQKHKLKNILEVFDPNLTEWENMQLNDYDRIWDCGNLIFEKKV